MIKIKDEWVFSKTITKVDLEKPKKTEGEEHTERVVVTLGINERLTFSVMIAST